MSPYQNTCNRCGIEGTAKNIEPTSHRAIIFKANFGPMPTKENKNNVDSKHLALQ
jgi:hypothetical protein